MILIPVAAPSQAAFTPTVGAPVVRVRNLQKRFAIRRRWSRLLTPRTTKTALADVSFDVGEGEILGLLGPNGAGKTTLLKILATLVAPDAGSAEIAGFDVVSESAKVRRVLAPVGGDERSLDWRLSATENLRFFGTLHGLRGAALQARVAALLEIVELSDTDDKLVGAFSSGMRQRLLIARGLLSRPRVLLLDEPTRSLDPLAARAFREFLTAEIIGRQGCTILLATHDPSEAMELCDRIAILDRGRLLATGTPGDLAREFGEERYRVWTAAPGHPAFARLVGQGVAHVRNSELDSDGWSVVEIDLWPDGTTPAEILASLVRGGAHVARFERVQLTVADLMDRVVARARVTPHA